MDLKHWLPFSVLFRLDKLNMAHAVETRSPFLDYRVVERALSLPPEAKFNKTRNKEILRAVIDRRFPPDLREKGKQAFYMPLTSPHKSRYRAWIDDLLNEGAVRRRGLFQWPYVAELLRLSQQGGMLAHRQLTALAMLESWFRVFLDGDPVGCGDKT